MPGWWVLRLHCHQMVATHGTAPTLHPSLHVSIRLFAAAPSPCRPSQAPHFLPPQLVGARQQQQQQQPQQGSSGRGRGRGRASGSRNNAGNGRQQKQSLLQQQQ
jgi:hypothetical protein